jgi:hypothetical protein
VNWWSELTIGDVVRALGRYRPIYLAVAAILALSVVLPGVSGPSGPGGVSAGSVGSGFTGSGGTRAGDGADGAAGGAGQAGSTIRAVGGQGGQGAGGAGGSSQAAAAGGGATPISPAVSGGDASADPFAAPDCDPATGRIRLPSKFAPPCVPTFAGSNGGATYQGVTDTEIVVAIRFGEPDPVVSSLIVAAGAEDTEEDVRGTRQGWLDLFEAHVETYGRKVKLVYFEEAGDDDEAERADAIKVATEIKAFAAWGGGGQAYREELAARGVICICGGRDVADYINHAPYYWNTQPSWEQWLGPAAEYIGKRLWGRNAVHAGDPAYTLQERRLGIVFPEPAEGEAVNFAAVEYMDGQLGLYGARFHQKISYLSDINTAQEQARTIIARLKESGITTVVFWGDPIAPIFLTQEATNQNYRPEWVIVGGNLVDTTFFGRTYDPTQWSQAFGVSQLWARGPQPTNEVFHLYSWHHGEDPAAAATYEIIYQTPWMFMTALHLAGPNLTPETFRAGIFAFPPSGGGPTLVTRSFGNHGLWPFEDYTSFDDTTEVWWDSNAVGQNEIGQDGRGMWAYVEGGKRYRFGQWPTSDPNVFNPEGAITKYDEVPPEDRYPEYEHQHYRGEE